MTKQRMAEVYRFLSVASMKRMTDDEKIAMIRQLREMKPTYTEMQDAVNDAMEKAKADKTDPKEIADLVNKAVADIATQPADKDIRTMSADTFQRLCLSNDWNYAQIDELEAELVKEEQE